MRQAIDTPHVRLVKPREDRAALGRQAWPYFAEGPVALNPTGNRLAFDPLGYEPPAEAVAWHQHVTHGGYRNPGALCRCDRGGFAFGADRIIEKRGIFRKPAKNIGTAFGGGICRDKSPALLACPPCKAGQGVSIECA